jgi:hypothetical protein
MRSTVVASAILATVSAAPDLISETSEPVGLLMWGGVLILSSVVLRPGLTRRLSVSTNQLGRCKPIHRAARSQTQRAQG